MSGPFSTHGNSHHDHFQTRAHPQTLGRIFSSRFSCSGLGGCGGEGGGGQRYSQMVTTDLLKIFLWPGFEVMTSASPHGHVTTFKATCMAICCIPVSLDWDLWHFSRNIPKWVQLLTGAKKRLWSRVLAKCQLVIGREFDDRSWGVFAFQRHLWDREKYFCMCLGRRGGEKGRQQDCIILKNVDSSLIMNQERLQGLWLSAASKLHSLDMPSPNCRFICPASLSSWKENHIYVLGCQSMPNRSCGFRGPYFSTLHAVDLMPGLRKLIW